jgi:lipopolysaccharide/colanic/teichoic acid biosynthesis glycosyltransferase
MYLHNNLGYQFLENGYSLPYQKLPLQYRQLAEWGDIEKRDNYMRLKRIFDISIGLAALIFVMPLLLICAIAIKLDTPGPVFFYQMRTGQGGRRFKMLKLRTMVRNAEELKKQYMHLNVQSYPDFKITKDPRITRIGKFLRKTSLDELPQIFNVIKGDMSLVGPRPTSFHSSTYSLWHTERLEAKPGITGLWQVHGRDEIDFDDRVRLDILYSRNQSIKMDVKILFKTFGAVVGGRGAH